MCTRNADSSMSSPSLHYSLWMRSGKGEILSGKAFQYIHCFAIMIRKCLFLVQKGIWLNWLTFSMPTKIVSKNKVFFCSSYSSWASLLLCNIKLLEVVDDVAGTRRSVSSSWSAAWVSLPLTRKGKLTWWPCLKTAPKFRKSSYRWWMKTSPFLVLESWNGHQRSFTLFTKRIWRNSQTRCQLWWMK